MAIVRSWVHLLWMGVTVVPYAFALLGASVLSANGEAPYRIAQAWLRLSIQSARLLVGIEYRVQGLENLPQGREEGAVLLVKHQSTYETFLMPVIMPHPLAYVFKKELLYVPFFGWAIGRLDMIHIDRKHGSRAGEGCFTRLHPLHHLGDVEHALLDLEAHLPRHVEQRIARDAMQER